MKRFHFIAILFLIASLAAPRALAGSNDNKKNTRRAWNVEMQTVKTDYLAKKLDLTVEQREKFVATYSSMEKEMKQAFEESQALIDSVKNKGKAATDADYKRAAHAAFNLKSKEAAIEKKYFSKYEQILTPAQLFSLKDAEMQFTKELMKKHSSLRRNARQKQK